MPLGLLSVATVLQRSNFPVRIVDINQRSLSLDPRQSAEAILDDKPDIIGFSTQVNEYPRTLEIAELCKRKHPGSAIILGGPQASTTDGATLGVFPFVDVIVRGECESSIRPLVQAIASSRALDGIPGLTFRKRGKIVRTGESTFPTALDDLPMPDYSLVPNVREFKTVPIEIGRGCPFECTFCSTKDFFQRRFRFRKTQSLLQLMAHLHDEYGSSKFSFQHDNVTVSKTKMRELCDGMKELRLGVSWSCSARLDCLNEELVERMAAAGCRKIFMGIETGSPRMQRLIGKRLDLDKVMPMAECLTANGIRFTASFMMGFPQETMEDLEMTIRLMTTLRFKGNGRETVQMHMVSPFPGTRMYEENKANLLFDGYFSDIANPGLTEGMRTLAQQHPEIFPSFYCIGNKSLDREFLMKVNFLFLTLMHSFPYTSLAMSQMTRDYPRQLLDSLSLLDRPNSVWAAASKDIKIGSVHEFLKRVFQRMGADGQIIQEVLDYETDAASLLHGLVSDDALLTREFKHDVEGWIGKAANGRTPPLADLLQHHSNQILFLKKDGKVRTMVLPSQLAKHIAADSR